MDKETIKQLLADGVISNEVAEKYCPELAESEDEMIRKALIEAFSRPPGHNCVNVFNGIPHHKIVAWLEKQGEQKTIDNLTPQEAMDIAVAKCFEQDEQKPADKVEPKFKVGDWIVFNGLTLLINEVVQGYYRTISRGGITNSYDWDIDNVARLWTIQDAKSGDVIVTHSGIVFIFKNIMEGGTISFHAALSTSNFASNTKIHIPEDNEQLGDQEVFPATKEQRDTLEKAMADAGYTFDFEKKELKKIEQKTAWSEEDKNMLKWVTGYLDNKMLNTPIAEERTACKNAIAWLEKLKDKQKPAAKVEPDILIEESYQQQADDLIDMVTEKSAWSEEDEVHVNSLLKRLEGLCRKEFAMTRFAINEDEDWLKSLKDRVQPQPKQ